MKFKKTQLLITAFIVFWIVFIGWGMVRTGLKLFREKSSVSTVSRAEKEKKATTKETKKTEKEKKATTKETKTEEGPAAPVAPQAEARPVLVRTFKVKTTDFRDILPVMGTVKGKTEIELRFEINGVIQKIYFREGEKIKKGDLIACLDPKDTQIRIAYVTSKFNAAQAAYSSIQKKLEVFQKLYEAGAIIKSKLEESELEGESAKFQVETARSEKELVENDLNKTSLYATKDGVMGPREAEEGEFVTPQDKIGLLLETSEVFVEIGVVERDIEKIKLGQKARVYVDAYPNLAFEGSVDSIFPVVEGKSRTLTAKIKVPNPEGLLFPGMFSRAEINICELKDALIIPATSLISAGGGTTLVPVIPVESIKKSEDETQTGIVELRRVNIGYMTSDYVQITKGLNAADLVVIEAQGELKDNTPVKIVGIEELSF